MINEVTKYYDVLKKKGIAEIIVEITGYPNDEDFEQNSPTCEITVTARDPLDPLKKYRSVSKELSRHTARDDRKFLVSAERVPETIIATIKSFFGGKKPTPLEISVSTKPILGWENHYESNTRIVSAEAGKPVPISVSLKPKSSKSRFNRGVVLDKEAYPKKEE